MSELKKIVLLFGMMLLMVACGGKSGGNGDSGSKELNIYTWTYFIPQEVIDDFQKETGIKVNLSYYDNNDVMIAKLMSGAKGFDIVSPSTDYVDVLIKSGLIEKLDKQKLGETFNNLDKDGLKLEELSKIYDPGLNYSIPYTYSATGVAVNKKFMKDYPQSFDIFLQEKYKGKMTMLDDGREVIGAALQSLGYPSDSADDKQLQEAKNKILEWKKNLAKLIAGLIEEEFEYIIQKEKIDFIVSVPINKKRENERGYNQVDEILKQLNVNYVEIKRVKNTEKMHKLLNEKLREENIRGSFRIESDFDFKNKKILLVDDIITTGATLREIKNSILDDIDRKVFINSRNRKIAEAGSERTKNRKTEITVFCLAAAREIKMNKGEV